MKAFEIENCKWKFEFQCPRRWHNLHESENPKERFCETCMQSVVLCSSDYELESAVANNRCVAVTNYVNEAPLTMMGVVIEVKDDSNAES